MIRLDTQYRSLVASLALAVTTNPVDCSVFFIDRGKPDLDSFLARSQLTKVTKTGAGGSVCDSPSVAAIREIDSVTICNTDTVPTTITVSVNDSQAGTSTGLLICTLAAGETLLYLDAVGWESIDTNGSVKTILPSSSIPWDVPGTIGSTTPNTGAFTTLAASSVAATGAVSGATLAASGAITGLTFNKLTITQPAAGATLTIGNGKTLAASASLTLAGVDGKTLTLNNSLTLAGVDGKTATFNNSLTFAGTDATTMTFPSTSAAIARTDTGQTFTGTNVFSNNVTFSSGATSTSPTAGVGYATGAGAAVTQLTSKGTTVTLNTPVGQITTHNAALAAGARVVFFVNNATLLATDIPVPVIGNVGGTGTNGYAVKVNSVVAGLYVLELQNTTAGSLSDAVVINVAIIKGVAA